MELLFRLLEKTSLALSWISPSCIDLGVILLRGFEDKEDEFPKRQAAKKQNVALLILDVVSGGTELSRWFSSFMTMVVLVV